MRRALTIALLLAMVGCSSRSRQAQAIVESGKARFTVIAPECIRIEYSENGEFVDARSMFAVNRGAAFLEYTLERESNLVTIDTGKIRLTHTADGTPFGPHNLTALIRNGGGDATWVPGMVTRANLGGARRAIGGISGPVDLGEGLLARDGWYLLDDSRRPLLTDDWVAGRPASAGIDWYLFGYGSDYKAALRAMTAVGGAVPMPRKYALGAWYSRYWPHTSKDYRRIVEEYRQHDFPLDVVVMDTDWHRGGWTGWSWNRNLLPDPEALLKWLHEQRLTVALNAHPAGGVQPGEDMYAAFMKEMGEDPATGRTLPFDAVNRQYLDTFFKHTHLPLNRAGVDFWWLDWQQRLYTASVPGLTNLAWLNRYYYQHSERAGLRGLSLSRWAGWGDHRNVIHFSGDADTRWPLLEFEVPFTATSGNVGCFFWSHDIGGHKGPRNEETYTRWVQFGAMSAALRTHSTRSRDLDRRPWTYSEQAEESMRRSFHLRSALFPYIYSSVWQSHRESIPLLRPMYLEHPDEERAYSNAQQYYFGDAFLVAPIVSAGKGPGKVATQAVWFPKGRWYNWFSGEQYEGDIETVVAADIMEFPLFVKGGVPIPMQPYTSRMAAEPLSRLVIRCYPGEDGQSLLYEDDGLTTEYLRGGYTTTDLRCTRRGDLVTVTVGPTRGYYSGRAEARSYVIELAGTRRARAARIAGRPARVEYDEENSVNRIQVPTRSVNDELVVEVEVAVQDPRILRARAVEKRLKGTIGEARLEDVRDPDLLEVAMAIRGVTMHRKNEGVYLLGGPEVLLVDDPGGLIDDGFTLTVEERGGSFSRTVLRREAQASGTFRVELPPFPVVETAPVGVPWVRIARLDFTSQGRTFSVTRALDRQDSTLRKWSIVGPFPYDGDQDISSQRYGPEKGAIDLTASYSMAHGKQVVWRSATCDDDGTVNLRAHLDYDDRIAYGATFLESDREQQVTFKVWSDDGIEIWLNGRRIHSHDVTRALDAGPDIVEATLRKGVNSLLVKVTNSILGWAFRVALDGESAVRESDGQEPSR